MIYWQVGLLLSPGTVQPVRARVFFGRCGGGGGGLLLFVFFFFSRLERSSACFIESVRHTLAKLITLYCSVLKKKKKEEVLVISSWPVGTLM